MLLQLQKTLTRILTSTAYSGLLVLFVLASSSFAVSTIKANQPEKILLRTVQKKTLSGIHTLKKKISNKAIEDAQAYAKFKKGSQSILKKFAIKNKCEKNPDFNLYCNWILPKPNSMAFGPMLDSTLSSNDFAPPISNSKSIFDELLRSDFSKLHQYTEQEVHRALRFHSGKEELLQIATKIQKTKKCFSPGTHSAIGLKLEEYFPDTYVVQLATQAYEKTIECPRTQLRNEDEVQNKIRFRLALIQFWKQDFASSLKTLTPSLEQGTDKLNDFHSRSLYWAIQNARALEKTSLVEEYRTQLQAQYPLNYHTLIEMDGSSTVWARLQSEQSELNEPHISFRSISRPDFNYRILAVEALLEIREYGLATELLYEQIDLFGLLEPEVRLYVALLFERTGDRIGKFRILSDLFRQDIRWLTSETILLFYPYPNEVAALVNKHTTIADPQLIASLIRQESGFNVRARSPAGALGLMQIMPATARQMERISRAELYNPRVNIRLGIRYFSELLKRYEGNAELALAAYNAGTSRVEDWKMRYPSDNRMLFMDLIPFKETRDYVALIARNYYWYSRLYKKSPLVSANKKWPRGPAFTTTLFALKQQENSVSAQVTPPNEESAAGKKSQ